MTRFQGAERSMSRQRATGAGSISPRWVATEMSSRSSVFFLQGHTFATKRVGCLAMKPTGRAARTHDRTSIVSLSWSTSLR